MKVISAYSIKASVGKTSAAVNLAYLCALEGARTLLWDFDSQAAATHILDHESGIDGNRNGSGDEKKLIFGDSELTNAVIATQYSNLDLVPANVRHSKIDIHLERGERDSHRRLDELLAPLAADYDCVVLDCPPGISLLSQSVFYASDLLLVPIIPTTLSVRAFDLLTKYVSEEQRKDRMRDIEIAAFFSMVDRRKQLHHSFVEVLPEERSGVLRCVIPEAADVERMSANRAPVHAYAPGSRAATAYEQLWHEVKLRMGNSWLGVAMAAAR